MFGFTQSASNSRPDHAACSGCSLCLLVCPVWRKTRDLRYTPHGRAKALQHGAGIADIAASVASCTLCGACEPVCPEQINLVGMVVDLRRQLPPPAAPQTRTDETKTRSPDTRTAARATVHSGLLPDAALRGHAETLARVAALLQHSVIDDDGDGADIALALETGTVIAAPRRDRFLAPLRRMKSIVVADGLLSRYLREWLPRTKIMSLGETLSGLPAVRRGLRATDLYVIEPRAYHADHRRLVRHYDRLRVETGCTMNLDLQRIAIPATARNLRQRLGLEATDDTEQARWILQERNIRRIVVESLEDIAAFEQVYDLSTASPAPRAPVVYFADLADDGKMKTGNRY